ncbi:GT4 family glycosyltransferase PelF [Oribacterium sp. WCC10]|uniref:GT4 family glycosyltransferase PelF n=1 Tax=Oribacterium sp. WCC10 TaxID=1855343 RepID=UPI0008F0C364|nr:GT4 family glycosyltransferase PelF [Oribacterium sp. WCC10]SFG26217.1 Glycosyltransferase involved in cell wall bisynthesis [Oribacterium sp. WCC10]
MRICVILEGCYPYVTGGVSTWIHQYMKAMPEHEFVIWAVGADSSMKGKFRYELPSNVVEIREVFLGDALLQKARPKKYKFTDEEIRTLHDFINCKNPDWEMLFRMYADDRIDPMSFLMSREFLDILTSICEEEYTYTAFSDFFHTIRSMFLPVLYLLHTDIPKADIYHSIATGYSGILARLGSYRYHVPYMISEHGIYTREREEEIIRAKWVLPTFKKFWVRFFYMLSAGAYDKAEMITSLYSGARKIQMDLGCEPDKCVSIGNGIHYERFKDIGPKKQNGYVDIGAVLRIAPIKDVKTMIYAFSGLKERVPEARLFIAGPEDDKEYARECYDLVELLGVKDINFMGSINVVDHMGDFDFTVLSSISEGMPLSVLESFAAGRPCVTTDVGNCKELLSGISQEDDIGMAGICVPPMDIPALTNAMMIMCRQPEKRYQMGIAGRNRVARFFLHEEMIKGYQRVYSEVFNRWQA